MTKTLNSAKCLIVDDLEENLLALSSLLAQEQIEVICANSGIKALELLLSHDFALALLDVHMPVMDGFELAEIMRSTAKTKNIPIIFVTAAGTDAHRVFRGYEAGAVDFLAKPLSQEIVISKVKIFLELYNQKKQLEQKLEKIKLTETFLNQALKSRDDFLSICSHELRTPLTSLKMQLQMHDRNRDKLGDGAYSKDKMEKFMSNANRSIERIIHLVDDMLDISRITTGRLALSIERIDLVEFTNEVCGRLKPLLENANCTLEVIKNPDDRTIMVEIDRFRIEQVVTNLLTNAAKYAPDKLVEVRTEIRENCALIKVIDHGEGISAQDHLRIFDRFERAVPSNAISGLGLGLFISKEILAMHNGTISVNSTPGTGATFEVILPMANEPSADPNLP